MFIVGRVVVVGVCRHSAAAELGGGGGRGRQRWTQLALDGRGDDAEAAHDDREREVELVEQWNSQLHLRRYEARS